MNEEYPTADYSLDDDSLECGCCACCGCSCDDDWDFLREDEEDD